MKKLKLPKSIKKNSKYKIDDALRYCSQNNNSRIVLLIKRKENYNNVVSYVRQKILVYSETDNCNCSSSAAEFYITKDNVESTFEVYQINSASIYTNIEGVTQFIYDTELSTNELNWWHYNNYPIVQTLPHDVLNFKRFKFAKIDKRRLEEIGKL